MALAIHRHSAAGTYALVSLIFKHGELQLSNNYCDVVGSFRFKRFFLTCASFPRTELAGYSEVSAEEVQQFTSTCESDKPGGLPPFRCPGAHTYLVLTFG